jgi:phosphatidylinositol alpha-1,6-mannosyltransferase
MSVSARRVLASTPLGARGGGIGQVSALLWSVMQRAWPDSAELVTMDLGDRAYSRLATKLRFGAAIGARQASGAAQWVLFTHLGLARAQRVIPPRLRGPYAVFLHGIESWATLDPADVAMLNGAVLRIANSAYTAARVRAANPALADIDVCPLALSEPIVARASRPPRGSGAPTALIVGRMAKAERYKGHDELIDVWPAVEAAVPAARLVVVGDGDDRQRLEQKAAASAAADAIEFVGFLDDYALERMYATATLLAMPSRAEGFGLVYLEAMAHALPCLGSTHDAAREVIADGETGLLIDPDDPAALAQGLVRLLADRAFAGACGRAGFARLERHFGFARFEQQILALLQRALESPAMGVPVARAGSTR